MRSISAAVARWTVAGVVVLAGCGSDSTGPDDGSYFVTYQANGSTFQYRNAQLLHGTLASSEEESTFTLEGTDTGGTVTGSSLTITVTAAEPITTRTYTGAATASLRFRTQGVEYVTSETSSNVTVTFTEIADAHVRGTFSGTVRAPGRADVNISNGQFFVPRH